MNITHPVHQPDGMAEPWSIGVTCCDQVLRLTNTCIRTMWPVRYQAEQARRRVAQNRQMVYVTRVLCHLHSEHGRDAPA